jgi:glycolate oxidase FAD binding subunit
MKEEALRALAAVLGADCVHAHEPVGLDGLRVGVTLAPASAEGLAGALRVLGEHGLAAIVRGGGTRLGLGNLPRRADCFLSLERLAEILELDAEEGVARVAAGTPLARLRAEANAAGWDPPLDAPGPATTLGGVLACAAPGPRVLGYGRPRDAVLGMEVALASGARARCGGRVVKNVTGYDLAKLYTGSLGTLGVLASAWLRLRPLPERVELVAARLPARADSFEGALGAARLPAARAVALLDAALEPTLAGDAPGPGDLVLVAELAGEAPVVEASLARVASELGARPAPAHALERVRELQGAAPGGRGLRVRVDALCTRVPAAAQALRGAGARLLAYPGAGLVFGFFEPGPDAGGAEVALAAAREAARAGGGALLVEEAPLALKRVHDVFGDPPQGLAIMRALKQRFDPGGVLNPGRFAGGI